jgi:hypothetical protein
MTRTANIFYNLVTREDTTTELLCNLLQFSDFRRPLLTRLLNEQCASEINFDDIDTQVVLPDYGRPDIIIDSDSIYALVEVKVDSVRGLTANQPNSYFSHVFRQEQKKQRWVVFLVPRHWKHREYLDRALGLLLLAHPRGVNVKVVDWETVLETIEEYDLQRSNPFLGQFHDLLSARFRAKPIAFTRDEVSMLFSRETGSGLLKLQDVVDQIYKRARMSCLSWNWRGVLPLR